MDFNAFKFGFLFSMGLVIAIGAQNASLIRLTQEGCERAFKAALIFFICDIFMVLVGAYGVNAFLPNSISARLFMTVLGAVFLFLYGVLSIKSYFKGQEASFGPIINKKEQNYWPIKEGLGFSLLNPHALIDTVVLIGGASAAYSGTAKASFVFGTLAASLSWFFVFTALLLYFGRKIKNQIFWRRINLLNGFFMFYFSFRLVHSFLGQIADIKI